MSGVELLCVLGMPFSKALQAEWRIGWQVSAMSKGHKPRSLASSLLLYVGEGSFPCPRTMSSFLSLPTSTPILWQELLDSTFSWYHGSSVFPLMPSQDDKEDGDEDEELTTEKVKRKTPEDGSRPPPDLARHDIIKVEGTLYSRP